ncbi:MAG: hypothetical protein ABI603_02110 [Acidobacteriota bacterium]
MSIRDWFRPRTANSAGQEAKPSMSEQHRAAAWLAAVESGALDIPRDVHDAAAWNRYWEKNLEVGAVDQGFNDLMSSDQTLLSLLYRRGVRKILCAGAGLSNESLALFLHGFDVTALDISSVPRAAFGRNVAEGPLSRIPGIEHRADGSVAIPADQAIDASMCPPIHRAAGSAPRGGGSLSYVTGDLLYADVCCEIFDAAIERRTVQLFPDAEQNLALDRLAGRLAPRALLVSHQHRGNWKPGSPREHFASGWLDKSDFVSYRETDAETAARVARLVYTTG